MKQGLIAWLFPMLAFAQESAYRTQLADEENKNPQIKVREVGLRGEQYIEVNTEENQILIKKKTPPTVERELPATLENQYERLSVFQLNTGMGGRSISPHGMRYTPKNGGAGPYGQITSGGNTTYKPGNGFIFDIGASFRIPTSTPWRRLSTGGFFTLAEVACYNTGYNEPGSDLCRKSVKEAIFNNWTVFSEYDVLVFKKRGSSAVSVGAYYQSLPVSHGTEQWALNVGSVHSDLADQNRIYQVNRDFGGVIRYKILESEGKIAFPRWELSAYIGPAGYKFTVGVNLPMVSKRINPPREPKQK